MEPIDEQEAEDVEHHRRSEDRDKLIHERLTTIEKEYRALATTVNKLEQTVTIVQLEQTHFKEMMTAHLRLVEESNKQQLTKLELIGRDIQQMGSDVDKTPVARQLDTRLTNVVASIDECNDRINKHESLHTLYKEWQDSVKGIIVLLKWIGFGSLIAIGIAAIKFLQYILR
jgi:DNA-binding ferritin-like protein (Dps family)